MLYTYMHHSIDKRVKYDPTVKCFRNLKMTAYVHIKTWRDLLFFLGTIQKKKKKKNPDV